MIKYGAGKMKIGREIALRMQEIKMQLGLQDSPYYEGMCGACGILMHMRTDLINEVPVKKAYQPLFTARSLPLPEEFLMTFYSDKSSQSTPRGLKGALRAPLYGSDVNAHFIAFMDAAANHGWWPPDSMTQEEYDALKVQEEPCPLSGFAGVALSFGGQWRDSFVGKYDKKRPVEKYIEYARKRMRKSTPFLQGVNFQAGDYREFEQVSGFICLYDPPYVTSQKRHCVKSFRTFDQGEFWDFIRRISRRNLVFVCEEVAPPDFVCVWEKEYVRGVSNNTKHRKGPPGGGKHTYERLFIFNKPPDPTYLRGHCVPPWNP